jgi:PAS domain S-box-containing protein
LSCFVPCVNSLPQTIFMKEPNKPFAGSAKKIFQELSSHKIELYQTQAYLHCILQNSQDLIFATDVDGIVLSFSKGGEKVLGLAREEVAGRPVSSLVQDPQSFEAFLAESIKEGNASRLEVPFRRKDGESVYCNVSLISLLNRKDQRVGTVGICRDITMWKKLQEELILVDRLAEIGKIASGIAHEINNPMAVIQEVAGWGKTVVAELHESHSDEEAGDDLAKAFDDIVEQTRRCRNITHQLLGFVRDAKPKKVVFDVRDLLKETARFLEPELKRTSVAIRWNLPDDPVNVHSDPKMLQQVLVNLLTNAIDAIREKREPTGSVEIAAERGDSIVKITVADDGCGIPEQNRQRIFDLFFTTKPPGKGTGLGMPITQHILAKLGAHIHFTSTKGGGTTFIVGIPSS